MCLDSDPAGAPTRNCCHGTVSFFAVACAPEHTRRASVDRPAQDVDGLAEPIRQP